MMNLTLQSLTNVLAEFEAKFPRKTTPASIKMSMNTLRLMHRVFRPAEKADAAAAMLQAYGSTLFGLTLIPDEFIADGIVKVLNADDEVIETLNVW